MPVVHRIPVPGELWLSRPPYSLMARVLTTRAEGNADTRIEYEILDDDGAVLAGPIRERLDDSWWRNFQPLEPRYG